MNYDTLMERMNGRPYTNYFMALCPFLHDGRLEQNPSLMVFEDHFYCKSCHRYGSLRVLEKATTGNYHPDTTRKFLPQFKKWERQFEGVEDLALSAHKFLLRNPSYATYLKRRKMDKFIKPGLFGFIDGWITLPVRNRRGQIVDVVCRSTNSKFTRYALMKVDKEQEPPLYSPNWEMVQEQAVAYVPFGMFDAWALYACELASITGTAGKDISSNALRETGKNYYKIIPDKGEEDSAYNLAGGLGWRGEVIRIDFPMGMKDVDEIYRNCGTIKLLQLLEM